MWLWLVGALLLLLDFHLLLLLLHITIIQTISFAEEVAASSSAADGVKDYYCCNICYDRQSYNGRARSGGDSYLALKGDDVRSCTFSFSRYTREEIIPLKIVCLHTIMSL